MSNASPFLVTGATGFLGRHVLDAIARRHPGRPVLALVRRASDWAALDYAAAHPAVTPLVGDLVDDLAWLDRPEVADLGGIFHLAAVVHHSRKHAAPVYAANVDGTLRLVKLAARRKTPMAFVSTAGAVACADRPGRVADEDAPLTPERVRAWPYYHSKVQAEQQARALADAEGVPLTILRPPVMLGPGDHRFRSSGYVVRHLSRSYPFMIPGGLMVADIRDVADAVVASLDHPAGRPVYHLPGHDFTIPGFFAMLEELTGVPAARVQVPPPIARTVAYAVDGLATLVGRPSPLPDPVVVEMGGLYWSIGSRHAEADLGYKPRPIRTTLLDTIDWIKRHHPTLGGSGKN